MTKGQGPRAKCQGGRLVKDFGNRDGRLGALEICNFAFMTWQVWRALSPVRLGVILCTCIVLRCL